MDRVRVPIVVTENGESKEIGQASVSINEGSTFIVTGWVEEGYESRLLLELKQIHIGRR